MYKKNHPPVLEDEVWRLEKIGKGGAFHQKLAGEGINTVQDFLKLFHVDSARLRKVRTTSYPLWVTNYLIFNYLKYIHDYKLFEFSIFFIEILKNVKKLIDKT